MGVLNITPDSFSDGGEYNTVKNAVSHATNMITQGVDIIDIGGESSRPGASAVCIAEELERVIPVIEKIRSESDIAISIDTSKPEVMRAAVSAGADLINDIKALQTDGALTVVAELEVPVCLMHMQGEPRSMQSSPEYIRVVDEVKCFLQQRINMCLAAGIKKQNLIIDPGFGFGKSVSHNLLLLKDLHRFLELDVPILVGLSRKSLLATITNRTVEQRLAGSLSLLTLAVWQGASIVRVHDVAQTIDAVKVCQAVKRATEG